MEWQIMDEIFQYINEQSIRGDLAREFAGIVSDFQAGTISKEDKDALAQEVLASYRANGLAEDEITLRWAVAAVSLVGSLV